MGNKGMLNGLNRNKWREYTPLLDVWAGSGGTTPSLGTQANGALAFGRYLYTPELVTAQVYLNFGFPGAGVSGGIGNYIVKLPVPCKPNVGGKATPGADRTLGWGNVNRLISFTNEQPLTVVTALSSDFPGQTYGGQARDWAALWCSHVYCRGTGTIPTSAASLAVSFPFTLPYTPNPEDIAVQLTSNPSTQAEGTGTLTTSSVAVTFPTALSYTPSASDITVQFTSNPSASGAHGTWLSSISNTGFTLNQAASPTTPATFAYTVNGLGKAPWVSGVSTTGFTLNLPSAPAVATTFAYKVDSPDSLLVANNAPFNWGAQAGCWDMMFLSFSYEPDA